MYLANNIYIMDFSEDWHATQGDSDSGSEGGRRMLKAVLCRQAAGNRCKDGSCRTGVRKACHGAGGLASSMDHWSRTAPTAGLVSAVS